MLISRETTLLPSFVLLHYIAENELGIAVRHQNRLFFSTSTKMMERTRERGFQAPGRRMPKRGLEALPVVEYSTAAVQHSSAAYIERVWPFSATVPAKERHKEAKKWQTVQRAELKRQTRQLRENN